MKKFIVTTCLFLIFTCAIGPFHGARSNFQTEPAFHVNQDRFQSNPEPGIRMVYGETDESRTRTSIWLATPGGDLSGRRNVADASHKEGYPPRGIVSPDGRWLACILIPMNASERSARIEGGALWLFDLKTGESFQAGDRVSSIHAWSPDSKNLLFSRLTAIQSPPHLEIPFQTDVYSFDLSTRSSRLVFSDSTSYAVIPLGWRSEDAQVITATISLAGEYQVRLQNSLNGSLLNEWDLPGYDLIRSYQLSPDGTLLAIEGVKSKSSLHELISLEEDKTVAPAALSPARPAGQSLTRYAIWSKDGRSLWAGDFSTRTSATLTRSAGLALQAAGPQESFPQTQSDGLLPVDWAPDQAWKLWRDIRVPQDSLYLQAKGTADLTEFPLSSAGDWFDWFGWTGQ